MGRHELIESIAARSPHLDRRDLETIVQAVFEALQRGDLEEGGSDIAFEQGPQPAESGGEQSDPLARLLGMASQLPDEVLDRPIEETDPELIRSVFQLVFDSVARSEEETNRNAREKRLHREEFDRRSREIRTLQSDIDARLQRLVG